MKIRDLKSVISSDLCLSCGMCHVVDSKVSMNYEDDNYPKPIFKNNNELAFSVCPAKGYPIFKMGKQLFKGKFRYEIGWYNSIKIGYSLNKEILKHASSGGIITSISSYLLINNIVDGVIVNEYVYNANKVRPRAKIANSIEELMLAQGSKYCPTSTNSILSECLRQTGKKFLFIGTPCQVASLRLFQEKNIEAVAMFPFTISNFCGGYRDFREIDYFVKKVAGFNSVNYFRHRGGGQPGGMKIINDENHCFEYPYPDYATLSPFIKHERCTLCIDAMGELSDFSCGDAWLKEKLDTKMAWSIVISRSQKAKEILDQMEKCEYLYLEDISEESVIKSQESNISSKKYRQLKRRRIRNLLFRRNPSWDLKLVNSQGSYYKELKILISKTLCRSKIKHLV